MKIRWISIDPFLQKMILRQKDNPRGIRPNPPSSTPSLLPDKVSFLPIIVIIIIIIARQKLAYGRQGLAGSWGQDTDKVRTFLVFLTSHFAPAALSSDLNQPETINDDKNTPGIIKPDLEP